MSDLKMLDHLINFSDHLAIEVSGLLSLTRSSTPIGGHTRQNEHQPIRQLRWDKADLNKYYAQTRTGLQSILNEMDLFPDVANLSLHGKPEGLNS